MGDLVHIETGRSPWLPASGSEVIEELRYYDAPLEGVLRQDGVDFVFRCIAGQVEPFSLWVYAAIAGAELDALRSSEDQDALSAVEADIWRSDRPMTIAFATNDGVVERVDTDGPLVTDRLRAVIDRLTEAVDQRLGEVRGGLERAAATVTTLVP